MPLFVPILRLVMLFLNIYESYKTLRKPKPSSRNSGQPSVRALSQRKRDMKGCLAVWLVWCTLATYERMVEGIVSLFIPFYDEFKSMALLFLILTRARGAEPIYLHIIRPLLKPYTSTLDPIFDILRMSGDFVFTLSTFPIYYVLEKWKTTFGHGDAGLESDSDLSDAPISRSRITLRLYAAPHMADTENVCAAPGEFPKTPKSKRPVEANTKHSSSDSVRSATQPNQPIDSRYPPLLTREDSKDSDATPPASNAETDNDDPPQEVLVVEHVEEWRKYPAFPSAYPPTPVLVPQRLRSTQSNSRPGLDPTLYPPIPEDPPTQDFHRSLLSPREPLNPGFVRNLSDKYNTPGVLRYDHLDDIEMAVDDKDNTSDDYIEEEEDDFNITLQTPLPRLRSLRSSRPNIRSFASCSTASRLSTIGNRSSLCTRTSSQSSTSSLTDSSSLAGKKRPFPTHEPVGVKQRVRLMEEDSIKSDSGESTSPKQIFSPHTMKKRQTHDSQVGSADTSETSDGSGGTGSSGEGSDQKSLNDTIPDSPLVKRRRVIPTRSQRTVPLVRSVRSRVTRYATPPSRAHQFKPIKIVPPPARASTRLRALPAKRAVSNPSNMSRTSSSTSADTGGPTRGTRIYKRTPAIKK